MEVQLDRTHPIFRCRLRGTIPPKSGDAVFMAISQLLYEDYAHLILDVKGVQGISPGSASLLLGPVLRTLMKGGGVAVIQAPESFQGAIEQLGLQTRVPLVENLAEAESAILRLIPKRYSSAFLNLVMAEGHATSIQIRELHEEYKRLGGSTPFGNLFIQKGFLTTRGLLEIFDKVEHPERYQEGEEEVPLAVLDPSAPPEEASAGFKMAAPSLFAAQKSEFFQRRLLGEILIELGVITEVQLRHALDDPRMKSGDVKIGDLLVQKGLINSSQLFEALELQVARRGGLDGHRERFDKNSEFVQRSLIGEILLEMKIIQEPDLRVALAEQRSQPGQKLGKILLRMGVLDSETLLQALEAQANRRT